MRGAGSSAAAPPPTRRSRSSPRKDSMDLSELEASEHNDAGTVDAVVDRVRELVARAGQSSGETVLLTIRHALTNANAAQITGSPDDELSEVGLDQARAAGRLLEPIA